ncbi:MAG TPA: cytochrome P460 family protein [Gemmatimonadales bacterium]|nr:cytochrome P460 family protein [Gemmatimonadales bacterium]
MKSTRMLSIAIVVALVGTSGVGALSAQAKYAVKVPGGLTFAEFRGYEEWQFVSLSQGGKLVAAILANPVMIKAYQAGIPGNGRPFPDGSKMAKIHWTPKQSATAPGPTTVPGALHDVDFMVKDSKRFGDSGGWGWAAFKYDASTKAFTPATTADAPPQANDAKCGFGCHTLVTKRDYVFTEYGSR